MKFDIPFDRKIFEEQLTVNFDSIWEPNLKKNYYRLAYGLFTLLMGFLILGNDNFGYIFVAFGAHFIINFAEYYMFYLKNKKKLAATVLKLADHYSQAAEQISTYEFNEENFRLKTFEIESVISWTAFDYFKVRNDNLILAMTTGTGYLISKKELGDNEFRKLVEFVQTKIKPALN